jgi:Tfp pilus assembly protein PilF
MLIQLEHDGALDIPAGARDFLVSDDFRLPVDTTVLAVYPHAHYLGHLLEGYATLPSGERKWLIRITNWDPGWQGVYSYRTPIFLPKGSVISMRYHYDNSAGNPRNPNQPPRRVVAGNQATDEMGHLWLQVLPATAPGRMNGNRRMELEEALLLHRLEKYPDDFMAHLKIGTVRLARLDPPGALAMLQTAVRLDPNHPEARNMLGASLAALGRTAEAIAQFRLALKARPDYQNARYNLARALVKTGMYDEAFENFRQILAALPQDTDVRNELGELYLARGRFADALEQFGQTLAIDPSNETARKDRELAVQAEAAHQGGAVQ